VCVRQEANIAWMNPPTSMQPPAEHLKRRVLMAILALSWIGSAIGWALMESLGQASAVLRVVFGVNVVFHPVMFVILWKRLLPARFVEISCLWFAFSLCAACMALRLYSPTYGASIDLQPLYLWIPMIYVFAFILEDYRRGLRISLAMLGVFVLISVPYLIENTASSNRNFTIQLHVVSAVLIAALYFFASHQHRLQLAQFSVEEMARLANTDELTKLANRRRMTEAIESELLRFARYGHAFSIILMDIDHFKTINDRFGHGVGDTVLVALAERAQSLLREVDTLGRWGGEEFVVILPQTPFDETMRKAAALCTHVAATPLAGNHAITMSCGVATVVAGDTAGTLLHRADKALYAAKHHGRNRAEGVVQKPAASA
ncbi:MAG: GGDEF domain-containing protein, partial [Burkholderiaceae bacterium]